MDIKDYFISSDAKEAGVIQPMAGHVVVRHGDSGQAYFAAPGDKIFEKDIIFTLRKSRCRLRFLADDMVTIGQRARIGIKEFVANLELKEKKTTFSMTRGKAMFYALKLFRYRKAEMSVETPTAVAGIRGTKFGVEVKKVKGESAASRPIYLADASETGWVRLAQAGSNGTTTVGSYTVVYSFDGTVTVTSTVTGESVTLAAGEFVNMFTTGAGEVSPTPEGLSRLFQDDTSAPDGGEGDEGAGDGGDDGGTDTGDSTTSTDVTQQQMTKSEEGKGTTTTKYGYFSAMLTHSSVTAGWRESYISKSRQAFSSSSTVKGWDYDNKDYMQGTGKVGSEETAYLKRATINDDANDSGDLGTTVTVSDTKLGSNDYMEWGYWTATTHFTVEPPEDPIHEYYVDNMAYYVFGDPTSDLPTTGTVGYSGNAYGTYWASGGGIAMQGLKENEEGFNCNVNFQTGDISNFDISVSGGGHSAEIENATGSFTSGSHFEIDHTIGTWKIDSAYTADAGQKGAGGSVYGPNAEEMGGVWGMTHTDGYCPYNNKYVVGIFQGTKGDPTE